MKNCKYDKHAHLYPLGMLTPGEQKAFEAHAEVCESCAAAAADAKRLKLMYKTQPAPQPAPGFEQRVAHSLRKRQAEPARGVDWQEFFNFNRALLPLAACLALIMCIGVIITAGNLLDKGEPATVAGANYSHASHGRMYAASGLSRSESAMLSDNPDAALASYYGNYTK